ncbi:hypothetical protein BJ684DRAFT_15268 [Piptocephalis cylindrospora]|uniref:FAS1 domain-containing protein n=1 Tax=Piptocephalis cylindrospora TaxID=1907219 RepID=A0A4P9Y5U2_9FUNG|nr:hypothetical protein BJ684DRAFT_15268 [Piptocephalis cylindrospora]|eukprot:RKP14408.1 hypothetical protein BJ684DRAFT_15268 [Piptocephalis cylindrospora]
MLNPTQRTLVLLLATLALANSAVEAQAPVPASTSPNQPQASAPANQARPLAATAAKFPANTPCLDVIKGTPELSGFNGLLTKPAQASLVLQLQSGRDNFTIFAPTNEAMKTVFLPMPLPSQLNETMRNPPASKANQRELALAAYHILPHIVMSKDFPKDNTPVGTMMQDGSFGLFTNKQSVVASPVLIRGLDGKQLTISHGTGTSSVVKEDIQCRNGVIHMINAPLRLPLPASQMLNRTKLTTTLGVLQAANKVQKLDTAIGTTVNVLAFPNNSPGSPTHPDAKYFNVTFRPTDWPLFTNTIRAYMAQENSTEVVAYEDQDGLPGLRFSQAQNGSISINGVPIVQADIPIANGVLHIMAHALDPTTMGGVNTSDTNKTSQGSIPSSATASPAGQPILLAGMAILAGWMAL